MLSISLLCHSFAAPPSSSDPASPNSSDPASPQVTLAHGGQLKGYVGSNGERVFRGVPYAQPPTGELRFRPPKNKTAWTGVRDALDFGAPTFVGCIQLYQGGETATSAVVEVQRDGVSWLPVRQAWLPPPWRGGLRCRGWRLPFTGTRPLRSPPWASPGRAARRR